MQVAEFESLSVVFSSERVTNSIAAVNHDASSNVLFFSPVGSRRVLLAGITAHPDDSWVKQQARNEVMHFADQPVSPRFRLCDHDAKYTREFDALLAAEGLEVTKVVVQDPNQNAFAERFVQSIRNECLDHFLVCGEIHHRELPRPLSPDAAAQGIGPQ
jgi:putative transposase